MGIKDLSEGTTETETPVAVWLDDETNEVIFQYGYASISMPVEDYRDFSEILGAASAELEEE